MDDKELQLYQVASLPRTSVCVVLDYDTSYANKKAGDYVVVPKQRAAVWIERGYCHFPDSEERGTLEFRTATGVRMLDYEQVWLAEAQCSG